jgi:GT2 family glycosyltransferase
MVRESDVENSRPSKDAALRHNARIRFKASGVGRASRRISGEPTSCLLRDKHILEGVWAKEKPDDSELSCLMGACYFVPREWYLRLGGLQFLRGWGCEEQLLSLKAYLSGGDIRLMRDVHIWHKFRLKEEKFPYEIEIYKTIYNKLFILHTMFQPEIALPLIEALSRTPEYERAREAIRQDWHLIVISERARNRNLLVRDVAWLEKEILDLTRRTTHSTVIHFKQHESPSFRQMRQTQPDSDNSRKLVVTLQNLKIKSSTCH